MKSIESGAAAASPPRPWPADRVEQWRIERLIPYANNPRLHSAADIERIAASILKWGWTNPVLVDEHGVLIAGHGRVAAGGRRRHCGVGHRGAKRSDGIQQLAPMAGRCHADLSEIFRRQLRQHLPISRKAGT